MCQMFSFSPCRPNGSSGRSSSAKLAVYPRGDCRVPRGLRDWITELEGFHENEGVVYTRVLTSVARICIESVSVAGALLGAQHHLIVEAVFGEVATTADLARCEIGERAQKRKRARDPERQVAKQPAARRGHRSAPPA